MRLTYTPTSIFAYAIAGCEAKHSFILAEELDIQKVLDGCSLVGQDLVAKCVIFKKRVSWDPGLEYQPFVLVSEAKWLPSDRDLRTQ